jgi:hypothetical protein
MTVAPWLAERTTDVAARARDWIASRALRDFVEALEGPSPATPEQLLRWSSATLDTRQGTERHDALAVAWKPSRVGAILAAAGPLGLIETAAPQRRRYDATLVLGGTTTGNRLRTRLAASLTRRHVELGLLTAVTAERPISPREHETAPESVADATEWKHLLRCIKETFGPLEPETTDDWREHRFSTPDGMRVQLLVTPRSATGGRATTTDGIRFFLDHANASSTLLLTSAIYAPYQFFAVAPLLLDGGVRHVELIGTPTATDGDRNRLAQRIAQELHAALSAALPLL